MNCPQNQWLSNQDYLRQFNRKAARLRLPLSGSIELTRRCNLDCVHCYLAGSRSDSGELETSGILRILEEAAAAGCLNLLLTGGEPLLRDDFAEIYRRARKLGLIVSVFTNGTRVTDELVALFQEFPPRQVEISLYGATPKTHETITRVPGSHRRCLEGVRRLRQGGILVDLKTILMTPNRHELEAMGSLADGLRAGFRFDPGVFPRLNGDREPLGLRIPPEQAAACDLADGRLVAQWIKQSKDRPEGAAPAGLFVCGAARTNFHVTPSGWLQPCILVNRPGLDLRRGSFREGWENHLAALLEIPAPRDHPCSVCSSRRLCPSCPAFGLLEQGSAGSISDYLCTIGRLRHRGVAAEAAALGHRRTA